MTTYTINLGLRYTGTDFERQLTIPDVAETDAALATVRAKVEAVNASISGGTDDGLSDFFRSDDFDSAENIGALRGIATAEVKAVDATQIL